MTDQMKHKLTEGQNRILQNMTSFRLEPGQDPFDAMNNQSDLAALKARADKAEAACALLRNCLFHFAVNEESLKTTSFESMAVEGFDITAMLCEAFSTDCGKGWLSPERAAQLEAHANELELTAARQAVVINRMREALGWVHDHGACNCGKAEEHAEDCPVAQALATNKEQP